MPSPLTALDRAIALCGGQEAFATTLTGHLDKGDSVSAPAVSQWLRSLRRGNAKGVPQGRCEPIEAATAGAVRVEDLRPDLLWKRDPEGHVIGVITPIKPTRRRRRARA